MAIVRTTPAQPEGLPEGQVILVDSNAHTNAEALLEIEQWARAHGLLRVQAGSLQSLRAKDGRMLRRGHCYRPYPGEIEEITPDYDEICRRVAAMPMTRSSVELTRE